MVIQIIPGIRPAILTIQEHPAIFGSVFEQCYGDRIRLLTAIIQNPFFFDRHADIGRNRLSVTLMVDKGDGDVIFRYRNGTGRILIGHGRCVPVLIGCYLIDYILGADRQTRDRNRLIVLNFQVNLTLRIWCYRLRRIVHIVCYHYASTCIGIRSGKR